MNKTKKVIIAAFIAVAIVSIGRILYLFVSTTSCQYKPYFGIENKYHWLFQDSILSKIHLFYSCGNGNEEIYSYYFKNELRFIIWELPELNFLDPSKVKCSQNVNMQKVVISPEGSGEIAKGPEIKLENKLCASFNSDITVNFSEGTKIINEINSKDYKCYFGQFNKIGIIDNYQDYQLLFTYNSLALVPAEFILYRAQNSFFIILINNIGNGNLQEGAFKLLKM
jgi:hypothetical protein